jgi:hypothetical protein
MVSEAATGAASSSNEPILRISGRIGRRCYRRLAEQGEAQSRELHRQAMVTAAIGATLLLRRPRLAEPPSANGVGLGGTPLRKH